MKISIILILATIIGFTLALPDKAQAQESQWYGAASYNMAIPLGKTEDFGGGFSALGFGLDFRYFVKPEYSFGIATGWQVFDNTSTDPIQMGNGNIAIQGTQHRYINSVPALFGGHYYVRNWLPAWCIPYVGLNVGTYWAERRVNIGIFSVSDTAWHFGLAPDLGIAIKTGEALTLIAFRYNYLFSSDGSGDLPYLTISLGAAWK